MDLLCLETPESSSAPATPPSILIIDDDRDQVSVLSQRLQRLGFDVLTANSGQMGLASAHQDRPHLILLDLRLPDMSGLAVCRRITDSAQTCGIPVIVVSAMEGPRILRDVRMAGAQYFLRKPYDPNALLVLIRSALAESWEWNRH
jgi:CheY-like chemotaxis protein